MAVTVEPWSSEHWLSESPVDVKNTKMTQFLGSRAQQDSVMALNKWSGGSELEVGAGGG